MEVYLQVDPSGQSHCQSLKFIGELRLQSYMHLHGSSTYKNQWDLLMRRHILKVEVE